MLIDVVVAANKMLETIYRMLVTYCETSEVCLELNVKKVVCI